MTDTTNRSSEEPEELKKLVNHMLTLSANSLNTAVDQFGRLYGNNAAMVYKGLSNVKAGLITGVFAIDPNADLATNSGRVAGAIAFNGFWGAVGACIGGGILVVAGGSTSAFVVGVGAPILVAEAANTIYTEIAGEDFATSMGTWSSKFCSWTEDYTRMAVNDLWVPLPGREIYYIDQSKCDGCESCYRHCPIPQAFVYDDYFCKYQIIPAFCERCGQCMNVCHKNAVKLKMN